MHVGIALVTMRWFGIRQPSSTGWRLGAGEGVEPSVVDQPGRPATANRSCPRTIVPPSGCDDQGSVSLFAHSAACVSAMLADGA